MVKDGGSSKEPVPGSQDYKSTDGLGQEPGLGYKHYGEGSVDNH